MGPLTSLYDIFVIIRKRCLFPWVGQIEEKPFRLMHSVSAQLDKSTNILATQKAPLLLGSCFHAPECRLNELQAADFGSHLLLWTLLFTAHTAQIPVEAPPEPIHSADLLLLMPLDSQDLTLTHIRLCKQAPVPLLTQDIHFTEIIFFTLLSKEVSFQRKRWASNTVSIPLVIRTLTQAFSKY